MKLESGNQETKIDFNIKHPEILQGEVFLTNIGSEDSEEYHRIGRKTKRMGRVAYDTKGDVLKNSIPVFVQRSEIEAIDPKLLKGME